MITAQEIINHCEQGGELNCIEFVKWYNERLREEQVKWT